MIDLLGADDRMTVLVARRDETCSSSTIVGGWRIVLRIGEKTEDPVA
jgi:hypothetical protein